MNRKKIKAGLVGLTLIYGANNVQVVQAVGNLNDEKNIEVTLESKAIEGSIVEVGTVDEFINAIEADSSANIKLTNDLNFLGDTSGSTIISVDFSGTIDGNGYVIKNTLKPIFNIINNGEIKNLIIDNAKISNAMGIVANNATDLILSNVHVMNSIINATHSNGTGGLVGTLTNGTIDQVSVTDTVINGGQRTGGIIGRAYGTINISNVHVNANITTINSASSGFIGDNIATVNVDRTIVVPTFNSNGTASRGGVIGYGHGNVLNMTNSFVGVTTDSEGIRHILGSGSSKGSIYEWSDSKMVSQSSASWVHSVATSGVNYDFFNSTLSLDSEIWQVSADASMDNIPVLTGYKNLKDAYIDRTPVVDITFKTVEEYDELIKAGYSLNMTEEYEHLLLQREFVKNIGYSDLVSFVGYSESYANLINWLINDYTALKEYTLGGTPDGTYIKSLNILHQLYSVYSDDLLATGTTANGIEYKDLYLRMMMTTALTHSATVGLWAGGRTDNPADPNTSDAVTRYGIYKKMFNEGLLESYFDTLEVEEMRFVMNNIIDDESIEWINWYTTNYDDPNPRNPYTYIQYGFGWDYFDQQYYLEENYQKWDEKYNLSDFGITYQEGFPKPWIVFEEDGVCGAVSKIGSNIAGGYGQPSSVVSQPGHAAYILYKVNEDGDAYWEVWNNISGWQESGKTEKLTIRMPNGWGSGAYASRYPASYVILAQGALNRFESYEDSEIKLLLANTYADDNVKLEEIYRSALNESNINFDAWLGLVELYISDTEKTDTELLALADEIGENLKYYPMPMYDLLRMIEGALTTNEGKFQYGLTLEGYLTEGTKATEADSIQYKDVQAVATHLLGVSEVSTATFSFDGDNAGEIVLSDRFEGTNVRWDYSLDQGETWTETELHNHKLTEEELESINSEDDILVHIVGQSYTPENLFAIDIIDTEVPTNLYNNDLENKVIGVTETSQWYNEETLKWVNYSEQEPDLTGNKLIKVRAGASGVSQASSQLEFEFTEDEQTLERQYVPMANLTLNAVSTEEPGKGYAGINAIDGNIHTAWFSNWSGKDLERYIIVELDEAIKLSAVEYYPHQVNGYGIIKDAEISVSMDGVNFEVVGTATGWADTLDMKSVELEESVEAKYVKIHAAAYNGRSSFIGAKMFNIFEDVSLEDSIAPTAEVTYSNTELTNEDVVVTLVNPSEEIIVTNNGGSTEYTFTENGEFTFEFEDLAGNKGTASATVSNIDKVVPTVEIVYSCGTVDNPGIIATISNPSEEIVVTNNGGSLSYTFAENGEFTFEFEDLAGNKGTAKAIATSIPTENPTFDYDKSKLVEVSINGIYEVPTVSATDGNGKTLEVTKVITNENNEVVQSIDTSKAGEYIITYTAIDEYGKSSTLEINVVVKELLFARIEYSDVELTNKDVVATLVPLVDGLTITNNGGSSAYTFTENGEFTFEYVTADGVRAVEKAVVSNIDKVAPTVEIIYSCGTVDNPGIIATISNPSEDIVVTNNGGNLSYTFAENGEFIFEFEDLAGNKGTAKAIVTSIPAEKPSFDYAGGTFVEVAINGEYEIPTVSATDGNGKALEVTRVITNENGEVINSIDTTQEGKYTITYTAIDEYGRQSVLKINVVVAEKVFVRVEYSNQELTNQDVVVRLVPLVDGLTITNNGGSNEYIFTENGEFIFEYMTVDGVVGTEKVVVSNIDKIAPTAEVVYSIAEIKRSGIMATLTNISEEVTILNNGGNTGYLFTENGEFTFEFVDKAGNIGTAKAVVNNITEQNPTLNYDGNVEFTINENEEFIIPTITAQDSFGKELEVSISITDKGGNIIETLDTSKPGVYTIKYTAVDEFGKSETLDIVLVVNELEAPTFNYAGDAEIIIKENDEFIIPTVTAQDSLGKELEVEVSIIDEAGNVIEGLDTTKAGTYTIRYTTVDELGKSNTLDIVVIVEELEAPTLNYAGDTEITIKEGEKFVIPTITAQDSSGKELEVEVSIIDEAGNVIEGLDTTKAGVYTVRYTTVDSLGKTTVLDITVTIEGLEEPKPLDPPTFNYDGETEITIKENEEFIIPTITAQDSSGKELEVEVSIIDEAGNVIEGINTTKAGVYTVRYTTVDSLGKTTVLDITVTIEGLEEPKPLDPPTFNYDGETEVTVKENEEFIIPTITAQDSSGKELEVEVSIIDADGNIVTKLDTIGVYTVRYTTIDEAGNSTTLDITVIIEALETPEQGGTETPNEDGTEVPEEGGTETPNEDGTEVPDEDGTEVPNEGGIEKPDEDKVEIPNESETPEEDTNNPNTSDAGIGSSLLIGLAATLGLLATKKKNKKK